MLDDLTKKRAKNRKPSEAEDSEVGMSQISGAAAASPTNYFWAGAGVAGCAGVAGFDWVGTGFTPDRTEPVPEEPAREARIESVIDVNMNMMADQVVALESAVAAPRGPKAVWLPCPPKAAAMSPLLPL
jgi:hypothetical protein